MRKLLLIILILFSVFLGYSFKSDNFVNNEEVSLPERSTILRVALVSDSHNENEFLSKALAQAQGMGVNFAIGLGDYTNTGTMEELRLAKKVFDESKLEYFVTSGDHDLWDSRNRQEDPLANFREIFGKSTQIIDRENVLFVILDNSDIYRGINAEDWEILNKLLIARGPVSSFLPASARSDQKSERDTQDNPELRAVGNPSTIATPRDTELSSDTSGTFGTFGTSRTSKLTFVFAQKTPFHPESKHVMGSENSQVASQAKDLMGLLEAKKVDGFFCGDLHFFAQFKSPKDIVKMTTIGAVASQRNFQGPRFGILTVYDDYSWEVEDAEIR